MSYTTPGSPTAPIGTWLPPGVGPGSVTANGITNQYASNYISSDASIPANGSALGIVQTSVQPPGTYLIMGQATLSGATVAGEVDLYIYESQISQNVGSAACLLSPGQSVQLEISVITTILAPAAFQLVVVPSATITGNITAQSKGAVNNRGQVTGLLAVRIA